MFKRNFAFIAVAGVFSLASSCTKKGATGPAGPSYVGAISGHISLYDQYGTKVITGYSGVSVQLDGGTGINPDNTGYYMFGQLTTGDYNMTVTGPGYATTKANSFQFLSDTLNKDVKLSAIPGFSPLSVNSYAALSTPGDSLVINFTADTRARNCIVFVNNTSAVGSIPAEYVLVYTKAIAANQTKAVIVIPAGDLYDEGITSGSTFYCASYGYVVGDVSVYEDLATGKNVYNAVSASPVTTTAIAP
jgi:hypothetical protein